MDFSSGMLLLIGAALLVVIFACYAKGRNYLQFHSLVNPILTSLVAVLQAVGTVSGNSSQIQILADIISNSIDAAGMAENLWLKGEIDKSARPEYAQEYIMGLLELAGIEVTENVQTIIKGAIAVTCYLMPHYTQSEEA